MSREKVQLAVCTHLTPAGVSIAEIAAACGVTGVDFAVTDKNINNLGQAITERCGPDKNHNLRFHAYFADVEIGDPDAEQAARSLDYMCQVVDRVAAQQGKYLTVHMGFNPGRHGTMDFNNAVEGLKALVDYAGDLGITICIENLRTGMTADPDKFIRLAEDSGASVTFDVGHFNSSTAGANGYSAEDIIAQLGDNIVTAHIYEAEIEGKGHIAPLDLSLIKPALDALSRTACSWWVVELGSPADICRTISLLRDYRKQLVS